MKKLLTALAAAGLTVALGAGTVAAGPSKAAPSPTIVDLAVGASGTPNEFDSNDGDFDVLVAAVLALGLDDDLAAKGQRTVFAPTDGAFVDLAELLTQQSGLTEAEAFAIVAGVPGVADIVAYHVAPGARFASDVVPAERIRTITKQFITKDAGAAALDAGLDRTANIVAPNLTASNGVVHGIDAVLVPEG